ncbi:RING finger protein [Echinococcus granulosus]|uniref:RING finger protein n=1 Tax=Echinococcus granulosus TaxID=6210 RepID=W6UGH5_ECHGR|nr:RING finger protein [Echinococcus granulosus]EUB60071.1 RING finger protein [Echinococcus granulosus]
MWAACSSPYFAYNVSCTAAEIVQDTKDFLKQKVCLENKVNSLSSSVVEAMVLDANRVILTLRQFYVLYQEIKRFSQIPAETPGRESGPLPDEACLLCCDACPSAILPCGHNFCRKCIDEWLKASFVLPPERHESFTTRRYSRPATLKNRQQCPLCRGPCPRSTEAWDMLGRPDDFECRREMSRVLLNLIYNAGTLPHPDH